VSNNQISVILYYTIICPAVMALGVMGKWKGQNQSKNQTMEMCRRMALF